MNNLILTVEEADKDQRVDRFLTKEVSQIKELAEHREILSRTFVSENIIQSISVNGKKVKPSFRLRKGDKVVLILPEVLNKINETEQERNDHILPMSGELNILMEDDDYLVINKPHGVVVHPGVGHGNDTLANHLKAYMIENGTYDISLERAGIVHRLDKSVGGLMVVAKTKKMQNHLQLQFEGHNVLKFYKAEIEEQSRVPKEIPLKSYNQLSEELKAYWISDEPLHNSDWYEVVGYITRDQNERMKMKFSKVQLNSRSKIARSYLVQLDDMSIGIRIVTGRMHQIRATLKHLNLSIKGDTFYGKGRSIPDKIDLRSSILGFTDLKGKKVFVAI